MAQLPPIIESLTGIKFEKLLAQVPGLKQSMEKSRAKTRRLKKAQAMRLFEAIIDANHRAVAGDQSAGCTRRSLRASCRWWR